MSETAAVRVDYSHYVAAVGRRPYQGHDLWRFMFDVGDVGVWTPGRMLYFSDALREARAEATRRKARTIVLVPDQPATL